MFAKPYKLKSNNALKNSEKKHLCQRLQDEFPAATEEKIKELVPVKSNCMCMKLVLHSGDIVNVYSVDGVPIVIEMAEGLVPTVCALWKVPELVPVLPIHSPVLTKVQGGAPVYLPGLETPAGGMGFPMFQRGAVIAMCTTDNAAAAIVGRAAISSADMLLRAAGVCLETLHVYKDQLCKDIKFTKIERPTLGAASYGDGTAHITSEVSQLRIQPAIREEWPSLGGRSAPAPARPAPAPAPGPVPAPAPNEPRLIPDTTVPTPHDTEDAQQTEAEECLVTDASLSEPEIPTDMDALLRWCLLTFLKVEGKRVALPLNTNLLYKKYLVPLCPPERTLEVKKSSYKKLSKFLDAMQQEGLLEVREVDKGVDAVVALNVAHPLLRGHVVPTGAGAGGGGAGAGAGAGYVPPQVREMFCITAAVLELFTPHKKGTPVPPAAVRAALTQYVKARGLDSSRERGAVTLDALLAKVMGRPEQEAVKWDALMAGVQARMTPATEMQFADGTVSLARARLEPVRMQVASRSGNKKVTLVSNLEQFGFSLQALSHVCQAGVAASCGVTRSPGAKVDQLMLQGDQTHFVAKLLIEKYGLPKKFVDGADKALNKKK